MWRVAGSPIEGSVVSRFSFILWEVLQSYLAQLGCDLLPEIWAVSFTRLVGTSSKDSTRLLPLLRVKMTVREFCAQEGSSPLAKTVAVPPSAGTVQMLKSPICDVKTIILPSGDQSGSLGLETPAVRSSVIIGPPAAGTV